MITYSRQNSDQQPENTAPSTEDRVGPIPVVRAGDGPALVERLDGTGALSSR